ARRFAYQYFFKMYGADWDRVFWDAARRFGAQTNNYSLHREYWSVAFSMDELLQLSNEAGAACEPASAATSPAVARPLGLVANPCALGPMHDPLLASVRVREWNPSKSGSAETRVAPAAPVATSSRSGPRARMSACFTRDDLAPAPEGWSVGP